jgi:squalene-hopene/tetraprenyl-beta-curcumene cyclase
MVYTIIALKCLGYSESSPEFQWAEKQLDDLILEEDDCIRLQPCFSPVWDTALAMIGLADAGVGSGHTALNRAADWLLDREIRRKGDWAAYNPNVEPSGWAFEYNNEFYADLDDTAMVLIALRKVDRFNDPDCQQAVQRSIRFLTSMQNTDNGWAAFDKGINNRVLEAIPFADHNAMLDPSCPDITARVLQMFGELGYRRGAPEIESAIRYLFDNQEPEGCWFGRWGVNYIYGTWQSLTGLAAIGYDMKHPRVQRAVDWLLSKQQACGGWGETCDSYFDRDLMGKGAVTPSQTAWALLGLMHAGLAESSAVRRGIQYLVDTQAPSGDWEENHFTGTGFPKVFYLKYHYYRLYFPIIALSKYRAMTQGKGSIGRESARDDLVRRPIEWPVDEEAAVRQSA